MKLGNVQSWDWRAITLSVTVATIIWFFHALNKQYNAHWQYTLVLTDHRDSVLAQKKISLKVSGKGWDLFRKNVEMAEGEQITIRLKPDQQVVANQFVRKHLRTMTNPLHIDDLEPDTVLVRNLPTPNKQNKRK